MLMWLEATYSVQWNRLILGIPGNLSKTTPVCNSVPARLLSSLWRQALSHTIAHVGVFAPVNHPANADDSFVPLVSSTLLQWPSNFIPYLYSIKGWDTYFLNTAGKSKV